MPVRVNSPIPPRNAIRQISNMEKTRVGFTSTSRGLQASNQTEGENKQLLT
jgi:hypothetical protein